VLGAVLPHSLPSHRRLVVALAWIVALTLAGLITPARGLASDTSWIPSSSSLVKTARTCLSPTVAVYYNTSCWTVAPDRSSPFYRPDGPYAWGQCTYWALEMRPDLWNNRSAADPDPGNWTAYTWPQHALLEGLTVDHAPVAGAVIVWPESDDNDSGHVAFVQSVGVNSVTGADLVTLQEMNDTTFDDPAQGQGDTMTMSMTASDLAQVQIIHPPGNTTGTVPTTPAPSVRTNPVSPTHSTPAGTSTSPAPTSTSPARTAAPVRTPPAPTSTSPAGTAAPVRTPPAKATKATKPSRSTRRHRQPRRSRAHRRAKVHAAHRRAARGPSGVSPPNR
jgi:surface antigen